MIYLVSPYSHPNPRVRATRFDAACQTAARLVHAGQPVIAPVVLGHPLVRYGVPGDWSFWRPLASEYLSRCDELVVLQIDGWRESEGVQAEIALAAEVGKRVVYLQAEEFR